MNQQAQRDVARKLKVLNYANEIGNIAKTCRYFGICRETFYTWKRSYQSEGERGLIDSRPALILQTLKTNLFISVEYLVAGFTADTKLFADSGH